MAIAAKTRKLLWARSGGLCAISRAALAHDAGAAGDHTIVGEECHIHSPQVSGPRHDPCLPADRVDEYDNLILLSRDWHKIVDDQPGIYPADRLRVLRSEHERWVKARLSLPIRQAAADRGGGDQLFVAPRVATGAQLLSLLARCGVYSIGWDDEPEAEEEVALIAGFMQEVEDCAIIASELQASNILQEGHRLGRMMQELEDSGWLVFGVIAPGWLGSGDATMETQVGHVQVVRAGNPRITVATTGTNGDD
jgi:hypothetical protein